LVMKAVPKTQTSMRSSSATNAPVQMEGFVETGPRLRLVGVMGKSVPPKVKDTGVLELQGIV
jgi:hypothetical protein